jgi:hypothetical protein
VAGRGRRRCKDGPVPYCQQWVILRPGSNSHLDTLGGNALVEPSSLAASRPNDFSDDALEAAFDGSSAMVPVNGGEEELVRAIGLGCDGVIESGLGVP